MMAVSQQTITTWDRPEARSIQVTVVEDFDALELRKDEWNALVTRAGTSTIFQTFEWHASWWKIFGHQARPLVLLAEAEGELVGIAPLNVSEQRVLGRKRRVVEFIGTRSSDYCDFIVDRNHPEVLPLLLNRLLESDCQWDLLHLYDVPSTSSILSELPRFFNHHGCPTDTRVLYEAPTRLFNDPVADRQLPNKKSLRRHYNYFQRSGQLEFRNCATAEEVMSYLETFFEQHIQRRAQTDTPSLFLDERKRAFYRELAQTLAPTGWLLFSVVLFNQTPIAMHFGFEYGGRFIWYKPAFSMDYAKNSPGEVLIKYLLEYALERGVGEFDFTIGEEAFKYRFANHRRLNYVVRVFRQWTPYRVNRFWLDTKEFVKRFPALARLGRSVLRHWRESRWA